MNSQMRLMLWLGLGLLLWLNFQAWTKDHAPPVVKETPAAQATGREHPDLAQARRTGSSAELPSVTGEAPPAAAAGRQCRAPMSRGHRGGPAKVRIVTDVLDIDASLSGGELIRADITQYPLHKNDPKTPVRLFNTDSPATQFRVPVGPDDGGGGRAASRTTRRRSRAPRPNTSSRRAAMSSMCRSPGRTERGSR